MTDREKQIRAERLARGWDDPYGDRRLRGASYAEAKAAARVSARQTARDLGALGADLARGTWSGISWIVRKAGRGLCGRLRRRRLPQSRAGRRILASAEALEKARDVQFPGPRTLGRLAWIEPPGPTPIPTLSTLGRSRLGIVLEAEARKREARIEQVRRNAEAAAQADELLREAEQPTIRIPKRSRLR